MAIFRAGTHPAWAIVTAVYVVAALALSIGWLVTESGPVRWLAEWQADALFDGEWYPKMTILAVILAALVPLLVIRIGFERVAGVRLTAPITRKDLGP